jgi:hypothetical protein
MRTALRIKFPDHQGKYREFSRFRTPWGRVAAEKASSSVGFSLKFPTQPNRELFWRNREFFRRNREFDPQNRESLFSGIALNEGYPQAIETTNESARIKY